MPFLEKKLLFVKKAAIRINLKAHFGVLLFGMILLAFMSAGCGHDSADMYFQEEELFPEEEFLVEGESAAVSDSASAAVQREAVAAESSDISTQTEGIQTNGPDEQGLFVVHICGAVLNPGVYELPQESRVMDAVQAAGGFAGNAAQDARNLAEMIADGAQIRIPTFEEAEKERSALEDGTAAGYAGSLSSAAGYISAVSPAVITEEEVSTAASSQVNINTANAAMLQTLPGIGVSRAEAIIAYREQYGAFSCIEDIMKVSGIKQAAFEKLKSQITV